MRKTSEFMYVGLFQLLQSTITFSNVARPSQHKCSSWFRSYVHTLCSMYAFLFFSLFLESFSECFLLGCPGVEWSGKARPWTGVAGRAECRMAPTENESNVDATWTQLSSPYQVLRDYSPKKHSIIPIFYGPKRKQMQSDAPTVLKVTSN